MMLIDMHAHINAFLKPQADEELRLRKQSGLVTCFSSGTPEEWRFMQAYKERPELLFSFGLHPWYADRYTTQECRTALEQCDIVGEIGMDSVWCRVSLQRQQKMLEQQLQLAADQKKPVILHTKGQEERIADLMQGFPEKICVHWYSGSEKTLKRYMALDCYFTLGPDTAQLCKAGGLLQRQMLTEIPQDRLFVETDGIGAVAWAMQKEHMELTQIPAVLMENLTYAANQKGQTPETLAKQMQANLDAFLS